MSWLQPWYSGPEVRKNEYIKFKYLFPEAFRHRFLRMVWEHCQTNKKATFQSLRCDCRLLKHYCIGSWFLTNAGLKSTAWQTASLKFTLRYLWNPPTEPNLQRGNDSWVHGKLFAWEIWHSSLPSRTASHALIMKELAVIYEKVTQITMMTEMLFV